MEPLMEERIQRLREVKKRALQGGGEEKLAKQHQQGKLTARERLDILLDEGSFSESNILIGHLAGHSGDGVIAGYGTIDGRPVCTYSQDASVLGGSIGRDHGYKMYRTVERAMDMKVPFVGIHDSPGARVPKLGEGLGVIAQLLEKSGGSIFYPNTQASGVIPQIAIIMGSCGGISVYSPALTDFIFMIDKTSHMFITGPRIVKSVMSEDLTMEELGGARVHAQKSGVTDFRMKNEKECLQEVRRLLSFLPSSYLEEPPVVNTGDDPDRVDDELAELVPSDPNKAFNMHVVIKHLVDNGDFLEVKREFAQEMIVGFGRLDGHTVGIVANQPMVRAGSLTVDSSDKEARFMRFCDCFNIPIIMLVDTPAYQPGSQQEHAGIIRHGAKVLYALCEAQVPRVAVVLRKSYGGGNLGMGTVPGMATDLLFYWPIVECGVMGAGQSVDLFYGKEMAAAPDPAKFREEKLKEFHEKYANPIYEASGNIYLEDVIEPRETRRVLIRSLRLLKSKKVVRQPKRHGNIPM